MEAEGIDVHRAVYDPDPDFRGRLYLQMQTALGRTAEKTNMSLLQFWMKSAQLLQA